MNEKEFKKLERELLNQNRIASQKKQLERALAEVNVRACSVNIGIAFGGVCEINLRRPDSTITFALLQPVEVVEIIHQLAANIGCHIHLQPRKDFASWREWKHSAEELAHYRGEQHLPGVGHPPHVKPIVEGGYDTSLPPPEKQPGLQPAIMARSESNEQTVATQKPVKRSRAKRAATPA